MKPTRYLLIALSAVLMVLAALPAAGAAESDTGGGEVVVADRASGTISVIDAGSDDRCACANCLNASTLSFHGSSPVSLINHCRYVIRRAGT